MPIYRLAYPTSESYSTFVILNNSYIPFDASNTDYQNFKMQINDETAQLETADGVLMTPEEAKAYVATLP